MKLTNKTILITGGSAGIGFAIARLLSTQNNRLILIGRNPERLAQAAKRLPGASTIVGDVSQADDVAALADSIEKDFPELDMVVNNAGNAHVFDLANDTGAFSKAQDEMLTNYLSIIRLNELLLPILKRRNEAAIVNVSSIVAYVPGALATYSASKAALHSYSLSLRLALEVDTTIKVFELMPPLVDTAFSAPIGGHTGISAEQVATAFVEAVENDEYEIRVGQTAQLYELFRQSPGEALQLLNSQRKKTYAETN